MKKTSIALALALILVSTLASCGRDDLSAGPSASTGQVTRRYNTQMNQGRNYFYDAHYDAGQNGKVRNIHGDLYDRNLTQDARDMLRDGKNGLEELGRDITDAARDAGRDVKKAAQDTGRDIKNGITGLR